MNHQNNYNKIELATFGGGCFWCTEAVFSRLKGVKKVTSGYSGGTYPNPTSDDVYSGQTGHAEVVQLEFDPNEISFKQLLEIFFSVHDPTTPNQQGYDIGTQYRSIILYHTEEQKSEAEKMITKLESNKIFREKIVTELEPFKNFYKAEEFHQEYFEKNPQATYCRININPKLKKLNKRFQNLLNEN